MRLVGHPDRNQFAGRVTTWHEVMRDLAGALHKARNEHAIVGLRPDAKLPKPWRVTNNSVTRLFNFCDIAPTA
jgi:hypothetical protein